MSLASSGTQYEIVHGAQRAIITEVGATLRSYTVNGRDIVAPFGEDALPVGYQGQHLLPWPNRIRDGRYDWDGQTQQLPINEDDRHNALHGLTCWMPWHLAELYPSAVTLQATLFPQPGWPGVLACRLTHWLSDEGLSVDLDVTNLGAGSVPFGYGAHPYFTFDAPIDQIRLTAPFAHCLATDDRLLPLELVPRPADELTGSKVGSTQYDQAFCGPVRDSAGRWEVSLEDGEHKTIIWGDRTMEWLQIYTPEDRASIAVEPMTCGPDAFNPGPTQTGLQILKPGHEHTSRWGIIPA